MTETPQGISESHGKVGASLSSALWPALMFHRIELPFYKKHPKRTGAALGIAGGVMLAPVAGIATLTPLGFASGGIAAGNAVFYPPERIGY